MAHLFRKLDERTWHEKQSLHLEKIVTVEIGSKKFTLKTCIKRDSYDFQSFAICYLLNLQTTDTWTILTRIPYPQMASLSSEPYAVQTDYGPLHLDSDRLVESAVMLLESAN